LLLLLLCMGLVPEFCLHLSVTFCTWSHKWNVQAYYKPFLLTSIRDLCVTSVGHADFLAIFTDKKPILRKVINRIFHASHYLFIYHLRMLYCVLLRS
jgi:hypothetical protein